MEVPEDEEPLRSSKEIISGLFAEMIEVTGVNPRKCTRLDVTGLLNSEDEDSPGIEGRKFAKGKLGKAPANRRHLKNIAARKREPPVDYRMRVSPDAAKHLRKLITRENRKPGRKPRAEAGKLDASNKTATATHKPPRRDLVVPSFVPRKLKPFCCNSGTIFSGGSEKKAVKFSEGSIQADHGSDINLISSSLVRSLQLPVHRLLGITPWSMVTADGNSTPLLEFVKCTVGIGGVWRTIYAFKRPEILGKTDPTHLLLGLPWLFSVDARINIWQFTLEIGDTTKARERRVCVQTPVWEPQEQQKLILMPRDFETIKRLPLPPVIEVSSSSSSEGDSSDPESSDEDTSVQQLQEKDIVKCGT
ncbi:hypothetical protein K3495_g11544 [Podosphaera aphanis]|nr:hypothetical protein K3495_g11544 [Podosphaera aphanis]